MWQSAEQACDIASAIAAIVSAWLWLSASRVPLPSSEGDVGKANVLAALVRQSTLNKRGAGTAAFAAIAEAAALLIHVVGVLH